MKAFSPLCAEWHLARVGFLWEVTCHQSRGLALFVWGAIKAESIVLTKVAEELLVKVMPKCPVSRGDCNDL